MALNLMDQDEFPPLGSASKSTKAELRVRRFKEEKKEREREREEAERKRNADEVSQEYKAVRVAPNTSAAWLRYQSRSSAVVRFSYSTSNV